MACDSAPMLTCSWATDPSCDVEKMLSISVNDSLEESFETSHELTGESFVKVQKDGEEPCCVFITLDDPLLKVTDISIVSEAKIIELYGKFGEYIKTVRGEPLDINDREDITEECYSVYTDCPTSGSLEIKFAGLKGKSSFWIYGIKILAVRAAPSISHVDYSCVDERLKSSNVALSEKAEKCMQFLQNYSKHIESTPSFGQKPSDHQLFMQMIGGHFPSVAAKIGAQQMNNADDDVVPPEASKEALPDMHLVKDYIDDKLESLEKRVMDNIEKQLKDVELRQDAKLDTIIAMLSLQRS